MRQLEDSAPAHRGARMLATRLRWPRAWSLEIQGRSSERMDHSASIIGEDAWRCRLPVPIRGDSI